MEIKIENKYLTAVNNLLFNLKLKGKQTRARSKFLKLVLKKIEEFNEDEKTLVKEYAKLDKDGEPIVNGDRYDIEDLKGYGKAVKELNDEVAIISGSEYVNSFEELKTVLDNLDIELEGADALAYDLLMDAFEDESAKPKTKTTKEEEK